MKAIILVAIFAVAVYSQGWTGGVWNGTSNCATNCSYCNSWGTGVASVCTQPIAGQTFSAAPASCAACPSNCAQCNGTTCVTCNVGYALVGTTCSVCTGAGYFSCATTAAGTTACSPSGAYLFTAGSPGTCSGTVLKTFTNTGVATANSIAVTSAGPGCCTQSDGNNQGLCIAYTACTTSTNGILASSGACAASTAVSGGLYYTATATLNCASGYYASAISTGTVTTCTAVSGVTLTATIANAGPATTTVAGYIPWCQVYNIGTGAITTVLCTACSSGFTINAVGSPASSTAGQFCVPCSTISASCPQIGVWAGYYFNTSTSVWAACPTNVATCMYSSSGVVPTSCSTGYYLQQQLGGVLACVATTATVSDAHGLTFLNTSFALSCATGYYSAGPTVAACVGCATCIGSVSNCSSCASGSTLSTTYTCSNGTSSNTSKGSNVIFSGLAFFSAILYYFL